MPLTQLSTLRKGDKVQVFNPGPYHVGWLASDPPAPRADGGYTFVRVDWADGSRTNARLDLLRKA